MIIEVGVGAGAFAIARFMPLRDIERTLSMLDALIRLDGVLFGVWVWVWDRNSI